MAVGCCEGRLGYEARAMIGTYILAAAIVLGFGSFFALFAIAVKERAPWSVVGYGLATMFYGTMCFGAVVVALAKP